MRKTPKRQRKLKRNGPPIIWSDIEKNRAAISIAELCDVSGLTGASVYNHAKLGLIRLKKLGGRTLITIADARAYLGL